jgi:azurin
MRHRVRQTELSSGRGLYASTVISVTVLGVLVGGCRRDEEPRPSEEVAPPVEEAVAEGPVPPAMKAFQAGADMAEISIDATDQMTFSVTAFSVKPAQMVRITLRHVGVLPAAAMGHNVVIIQRGEDYMGFTADASEAGGNLANHYLPGAVRDRVIAFTPMIGGGQATSVEFKAPETPGGYPFLCTFPGHAPTMNGVMTVEG